MICAIDTETQGLDCTKYITGCLITERCPEKPEIYDHKEELWKRILELGTAEAKRGKTLQVYAHNHQYDFYAYADLTDTNIKWFCEKPFITAYLGPQDKDGKRKEIIKFLDTYGIYRMSLAKMAELWGMKKTETPNLLKTGRKPNTKELRTIKEYMIQDTKIVLQTIINLKNKLNTEGIKVKRIYTSNQIAMNYLINDWRKNPENQDLFWNTKTGEIKKTWYPEQIHQAYRGGRVQALQTGKYTGATTVDINSLYPYIAAKMAFPDLNKVHKIRNPEILTPIGISKACLYNYNNELGILPIRTPNGSHYPGKGKILIGVWTNKEIKTATSDGYELLGVEWTINYEQRTKNPLKEYMERLYHLRKDSQNKHDNYFYKQMMNSCLGKFAQNKEETETVIDSVEKTEEYLTRNYKIIKGLEYNYLYRRNLPKQTKKYYCPIIPTLVNAESRLHLYSFLKQIKPKDLLYCDTDSITLLNYEKYAHLFKIGNEMGEWKIEEQSADCEIIARKTWQIGTQVKISGMHKNEDILKQWQQGIITDQKMITLKTTNDYKKAGTFETNTRDLKQQAEDHTKTQELLQEAVIHIDESIEDVTYFLPTIAEYLKD